MAAVGIQQQGQLFVRDKAPILEEGVLVIAEHILRQLLGERDNTAVLCLPGPGGQDLEAERVEEPTGGIRTVEESLRFGAGSEKSIMGSGFGVVVVVQNSNGGPDHVREVTGVVFSQYLGCGLFHVRLSLSFFSAQGGRLFVFPNP